MKHVVKRPFGVPNTASRLAWVDIIMGRRAPTRYLQGGKVFNVFTGELMEAGVAIYHDRIAAVGPETPKLDDSTVIDDVTGYILVPGFIDIHIHPFNVNSPQTFHHAIAQRGTTTIVADIMPLLASLGSAALDLLDTGWGAPVRVLWGLRVGPQSQLAPGEGEEIAIRRAFGVTLQQLVDLLDHPRVVEVFEWSSWSPAVRQGDPVPAVTQAAAERSMRIDVHAPGASPRTLLALAALGATDCHESLTAEDVLHRLRSGLYAPIRHSSLRPDLPQLVAAVRATDGFERLLLTSDGAMPDYLAHGLMDQVIATAIANGVAPGDAIRMATLHPAAYLGLDQDLGALAPGRLADILLLKNIDDPVPQRVYIGGQPMDEIPPTNWSEKYLTTGTPVFQRPPTREDFLLTPAHVGIPSDYRDKLIEVPVIELTNPVITRLASVTLPVVDGVIDFTSDPSLTLAVIFDEQVGRSSRALIRGAGRIPAIATTYTCALSPMILGRDVSSMLRVVEKLQTDGAGLYVADSNRDLFTLTFPIAGIMSALPALELANLCRGLDRVLAEFGYVFGGALYMLPFLSADHLPGPRLTPSGLWDVRSRKLIYGASSFPAIR